jgi:hypothetical protein
VASVRPFGVFVRPAGHPQDALVHASQVNEQLSFSRDDEDADKVKALEFFAPPHSQVNSTLSPQPNWPSEPFCSPRQMFIYMRVGCLTCGQRCAQQFRCLAVE